MPTLPSVSVPATLVLPLNAAFVAVPLPDSCSKWAPVGPAIATLSPAPGGDTAVAPSVVSIQFDAVVHEPPLVATH